ncbi:MAG: ComEC/Rec2 family competence protein, partial [Pseudomonadota bacterium]
MNSSVKSPSRRSWRRLWASGGVEHGPAPGRKGRDTGPVSASAVSDLQPGALGAGGGDQPRAPIRETVELRTAAPILFAFALATGAFAYFALPSEPGWTLPLIALAATSVGLVVVQRMLGAIALVCAGVALGLALGFAHAKNAAERSATRTVSQAVGPVQLEGWVRQVESGRNGPRLRIQVHAIQSMDTRLAPQTVRVTHPLSLAVGPGRYVRCRVVLRPPPAPAISGDYDFRRQAFFEGLGAVGYVQGRCRGGALGAPRGIFGRLNLWIDSQRRRLAEYVVRVSGERAGGFAAALVSGDRSFMDTEDQEALRASGLAHLLAISGLHLAIVCGIVYLIVRRSLGLIEPLALRIPVQKPAAAFALLAGGIYLVLSGASVSTQRAFIMAAIFFGAILVDRPGFSLRAFAVAMIAVIAIDPVSVTSPGFQMSFAATGALIATYKALTRRRADKFLPGGRNRLYAATESLVVTSLVASLATAPFALYHFDRVSGAGLVANLLAMPIVSVAAAPSAGLALILAPFGLSEWGLRLFGLGLEAVLVVAHWAAAVPGQSLVPNWPMPGWGLALLVAAVGWSIVVAGWVRWAGLGLLPVAAFVVWSQIRGADFHWAPNGDLYIAGPSGVLRVVVADGDGLGPLRYSDLPAGARCETGTC